MAKKKYVYAMVLGRVMLCEVMPQPKEPKLTKTQRREQAERNAHQRIFRDGRAGKLQSL